MKQLLLILSLFLSLSAFGQKDSGKMQPQSDSLYTAWISVSAGVSIPVGVYAYNQTTINNAKPSVNGTSDYAGAGGFAEQGSNITITAIAALKRPGTSFMGQFGYYQNKFDVADYAAYNTNSQNNFYASNNTYTTISSSSYQIMSLTFGMYMPIKGLKFTLGLRMMGGAVLCISPDVEYAGQSTLLRVNNTTAISNHIASATTVSWAITAALDARYIISNRISALACVGFFFCLPKFDAMQTDISGNGGTIRLVCPTSLVNINAGIGYRI